jgi:hypothetical protein
MFLLIFLFISEILEAQNKNELTSDILYLKKQIHVNKYGIIGKNCGEINFPCKTIYNALSLELKPKKLMLHGLIEEEFSNIIICDLELVGEKKIPIVKKNILMKYFNLFEIRPISDCLCMFIESVQFETVDNENASFFHVESNMKNITLTFFNCLFGPGWSYGRFVYFSKTSTNRLTINNCEIRDIITNYYSFIYVSSGEGIDIISCIFTNITNKGSMVNRLNLYGGVLFCEEIKYLNISTCFIADCSLIDYYSILNQEGGFLYGMNINNIFINNLHLNSSEVISNGGSIFVSNSYFPSHNYYFIMSNCSVLHSGSLEGDGGGLYIQNYDFSLFNCCFSNCYAVNGGAIAIYSCVNTRIVGCRFEHCKGVFFFFFFLFVMALYGKIY